MIDTNCPGLVQEFCLTKPICGEVPRKSVSIANGN